MASAISSRIGSLCGNFMGSSKCLSSDATTITREGRSCKRKDTCRVCFTSQWKPSSGLNQGNQKVARESEFSSVALNASTGSACPEEWWRRASQTQIGQPSLFPCKAFDTQSTFPALSASDWHPDRAFSPESTVATKVYSLQETNTSRGSSGGVPVYVMLPLDSISVNNTVNRRRAMNASLLALKSAGVEGVMMDVWWGLVERDEPGKYNWSGYKELIDMVKKHGLKIQAVMSFHQCGGNVGDSCCIPLPKWVVEEMDRDPNFAYTDKHGRRNYEYISLGCGTLPVLKGRTPVQAYADYMRSFRDTFKDLLGDTIVEIQVGMGPAGELRYPSYPESNGTWRFPGIGEFQCYDKYMLASLQAAAERKGKKEWGQGGPGDAGHYNNWPEETDFFRREGGWKSPYGEFLLGWYSDMLLAHGERILTAAEGIFRGTGAKLSGKVAGIHWHYGTRSHGPELTAGYYNTRFKDGYLPIARMFGRHGVVLNFTCIEMRDIEQPSDAQCSPEKLIKQVVLAARKAGVSVAGENALPRFDEAAHRQVVRNSRLKLQGDPHDAAVEPMCAFTFLRMNQALFQTENWRHFVPFVRQMAEGRTFNEWEEEHRATESFVHATRPLVQEAEAAMAYS